MSLARNRIVGLFLLLVAVGIGTAVAFNSQALKSWLASGKEAASDEEQQGGAGHDGGQHVALTEQARHNLGLETGRVVLTDYFRTLRVPGVVLEKPGHSDHAVTTTVHGIVKKIHALPGQTVKPGDRLFELQLTGDALAAAQSSLLDLLQQLQTNEAELQRISKLAASGGVAGKRKLDLEYERKRLDGQRNVRAQELLVRGLLPEQAEQIVATKKLLRQFTVTVPGEFADAETARPSPEDPPAESSPADALDHAETQFTVETLDVFPGKSVRPGDSLCHLAYHTELYVEGQAFENEIEAIGRLRRNGWTASLEFGTQGHERTVRGMQILYLDNHVDSDSQTFRFYVALENEVLDETRDAQENVYRTWRYKPGQRAHVIIPVEKLERQIVLPLGAVVQQGPQAFVFRRIARMRAPDGQSFIDEFEQVPVHILKQDTKVAVLAADGAIRPGDLIARNNAYQLQLALTSNAGGGGHSHHGHSH